MPGGSSKPQRIAGNARAWATAALSIMVVGLVGFVPQASATGHVPPRVSLEVGGEVNRRSVSMGEWYGRPGSIQPCPMLAIDPAPGEPRPLTVRRRSFHMKVVYATAHRPVEAFVEVYRASGTGGLKEAVLSPRRDTAGDIYAWQLRFQAHVGRELGIYPSASWSDENGCGYEYIHSYFRVRGEPD